MWTIPKTKEVHPNSYTIKLIEQRPKSTDYASIQKSKNICLHL